MRHGYPPSGLAYAMEGLKSKGNNEDEPTYGKNLLEGSKLKVALRMQERGDTKTTTH